jgi:hypothetical protein
MLACESASISDATRFQILRVRRMDALLVLFLFVVAWIGMDYLFSVQSGWRALAEEFRAGAKPVGLRVRWQVVRFGSIPEAGVTNMIPTTQGLYLYAGLLYRSFRPPLLIPWPLITFAREVRELWWRRYEIAVAGATRIRISHRAYRRLEPFLATTDRLTSRLSGPA